MRTLLSLAWRNLWRNRRRTVIALMAVVLGLVLLLLMDGLISGADRAIFANMVRLYGGNVQVHAPGYRDRAARLPMLALEDADRAVAAAARLPTVVAASKRIQTSGLVSAGADSHAVVITGVEPDVEAPVSIVAQNMATGRYLMEGEGDAVVIGRGLADFLGVDMGDRVAVMGRESGGGMHQRKMTVVGIFDLGMVEAEEGMVFVTLPEAQSLYGLRDQATEVAVVLGNIGGESEAIRALEAALPGYEVDSWETLRPEFREVFETKLAFTGFIGLVVLFIAGIGVLNVLLVAVFERTREMGVLAALGMKGRQLMTLFLIEGTLIGVVGAVIGCGLGLVLVGILGQVGIDYSFASGMGEITALMGDRLYPSLSLSQVVSRGVVVVLITVFASAYPAWLATRKHPADILHHV